MPWLDKRAVTGREWRRHDASDQMEMSSRISTSESKQTGEVSGERTEASNPLGGIDLGRAERKARLRRFHEESTKLGHVFWGVTGKTWREWLSDRNKKDVPHRVIDFIDGEARYDRSVLASPQVSPLEEGAPVVRGTFGDR